jgi:bifunctional DNase/RNase
MPNELIQLTFDKIMQTRTYTMVVLGTRDKRFAIYIDPAVGKIIQMYLTGAEKARPLTYDLIGSILKGFDVRVKQVVINDVQESIYYARLYLDLEKNDLKHILEIDARPSDCIMLALMHNVPVYCTREVLNKTIAVPD